MARLLWPVGERINSVSLYETCLLIIIINEVKLMETKLTKFAFQSIPFIIVFRQI